MIFPTFVEEKIHWDKGIKIVCGIDEVGRGCFAGPMVAAAVALDKDFPVEGIADSKLLTPKKRNELSEIIKEKALCWSIVEIEVDYLNEHGLTQSTQKAFIDCVQQLAHTPEFILLDAFAIKDSEYADKQKAIVKGDQISVSIAAASIIAKVYRDELMERLDIDYPGYSFAVHKGYGTKSHREAIKKLGLSPLHRTCFKLDKFL
jgi:ribonuclease HII